MKNINNLPKLLLVLIVVSLLSACYEEEVWLEDNITPSGEYFPTIYMNSLENEYQAGDAVPVVLEFASQGTLQEIVLYQTLGDTPEEVVSRNPYQPAFSQVKAQDTLALVYTVPAIADTIEVELRAEAVNSNGLTTSSSESFEAVP
ncbi:MAG: hypothetical protein WA958_17620 [Tunicatimonas sp.]